MKKNKLYTVNRGNLHAFGDWLGASKLSDSTKGMINAGASTVGSIAGNAIADGYEGAGTQVGEIGSKLGSAIGMVNPVAGAIVSVGSQVLGGLGNRAFGIKTNYEKLNAANNSINYFNNFTSNAGSFDELKGPESMKAFSNPYKGGWFRSAAGKNEELKNRYNDGKLFAERSVLNNAGNIMSDQINNAIYKVSAFGGPLGFNTGALGLMQQNRYLDTIDRRTDAIAKNNAFKVSPVGKVNTFDLGGLKAAFLDNFSSDPIGAAVRYNQGLSQMEEEEEAAALEAAMNEGEGIKLLPRTEIPANVTPEIVSPFNSFPSPATLESTGSIITPLKEDVGRDYTRIKSYLKGVEKFSNKAYVLGTEEHPTIGYGFYNVYPGSGEKIKLGDKISRERADKLLDIVIQDKERDLSAKIPNWDKLANHQKDALLDLAFNAGSSAAHFKRNSRLMRALAREDWDAASRELATTSKDPDLKGGLVNRSNKRKNMFINGDYAFGGELGTNGTDFSNGLLQVNAGGTHESNPLDGVPMGVDEQGIPNLVEEGETVFNDYVFSNRMHVPSFMHKELGLGGSMKKKISFADASKKLAKESEQRPNDPISMAGLEASLSKLAEVQEAERAKKNMKEYVGLTPYACGGKMARKYPEGGSIKAALEGVSPAMIGEGLITPRVKRMIAADKAGVLPKAAVREINTSQEDTPPVYDTWMRYAPPLGNSIMVATDLLGLTNNPDYTYANKLEAIANRAGYAPDITYEPNGDYMKYTPMNNQFYLNQLQASSRATDRALLNTSSPSRAAGIVANGYNTTLAQGNLARQAEEYNRAQYERVKDFNRKTNMFNSQLGLEAAIANAKYRQQAQQFGLSGMAQAAAMREAIDQRIGAARSANITNLLTSLGNIGRENFALNQINWDRSNKYGARANGTSYHKKPSAHGGKINKRK